MQIHLNQDEIHAAVEQYVRGQINLADNQAISIDFTAGRGANGLSATLDIRPVAAAPSKKPALRSVETVAEPEPEVEEPAAEPEAEAPEPEPSSDADEGEAPRKSIFSKS